MTIKENGEKFDMGDFRKNFTLPFCITVYRFQGVDVDTHFNIFDAQHMNKKHMYTALSRSTKFEYIHIDNQKKTYYYNQHNKHETISIGQTEYQNGKIYRIDFDDSKIYIGSTIKSLEERLNEHLKDHKSIVYKHRDQNPRITLVSLCPSKNKYKLENIETRHINKFAKEHSTKLLNKRGIEKEPPKIRYSFKIEKEYQLMARIEKMIAIKDDKENQRLEIQFTDPSKESKKGKRIKITKRYKLMDVSNAWGYMKEQQGKLRSKLKLCIF